MAVLLFYRYLVENRFKLKNFFDMWSLCYPDNPLPKFRQQNKPFEDCEDEEEHKNNDFKFFENLDYNFKLDNETEKNTYFSLYNEN